MILPFFYLFLVFITVTHVVFVSWLICSTSSILLVWFFYEFTTIGVHHRAMIKSIIRFHGLKVGYIEVYRSNDFGLWKVKMEAVLVHQKCAQALKGEGALPVTMLQAEKTEMVNNPKVSLSYASGIKFWGMSRRNQLRHRCGQSWSRCIWPNL